MTITSPRSSARWYNKAPIQWANPEEWPRLIAEVVNQVIDGKINSLGSLTLTANAASSTITDSRIGPSSYIGLMPTTASAAAALATTYFACGDGSATVHHTNNAQTDRTFRYVILGG